MPGGLDEQIVSIISALEREGRLPARFKGNYPKTEIRFGDKGGLVIVIAGPKKGSWKNFGGNAKGGPWQLIAEYHGGDVAAWLKKHRITSEPNPRPGPGLGQVLATYDYTDEQGKLLFQVVRFANHEFRQRRPDGKGGWKWGLKGIRRVLYHLPELLAAKATGNGHPPRVYLTEGEKDADRLIKDWGVCATTNPGGAGNWDASFNQFFAGFEVVLLEDNDPAGQERSARLGQALTRARATVKIIPPLGTDEHSDISDWLDDGLTQSIFEDIIGDIEPVQADPQPVDEDEQGDGEPDDVGERKETFWYQDRDWHRDVGGGVYDEFGRRLRRNKNGKGWTIERPARPWWSQCLSHWQGKPLAGLDWFIEDWIPLGQSVGLYGRPSVGKSLLLEQACICAALPDPHIQFCGLPVRKGPVYGLFCEDSEKVLALRADKILRHLGRDFEDLRDCHLNSLVGYRITEFATFTRAGTIHTSPEFDNFCDDLRAIRPVIAVLDVAADFFGGNEIVRRDVHQFLRLLDFIGMEIDCAMMYTAHPSLSSIADKTFMSGSTGWGKGRARLAEYDPAIETPESEEVGKKPLLPILREPSNERILCRAKANYAKNGEFIELVIDNGVYVRKSNTGAQVRSSGPIREGEAEAFFVAMLTRFNDQQRWVSPSIHANKTYAPNAFRREPGHDFSVRELELAMGRLFDAKRIEISHKNDRSNAGHLITTENHKVEQL